MIASASIAVVTLDAMATPNPALSIAISASRRFRASGSTISTQRATPGYSISRDEMALEATA